MAQETMALAFGVQIYYMRASGITWLPFLIGKC